MDTRKTTYDRLIQSETAEQILSKAKIHLDNSKLRSHIISNNVNKRSEVYRFMKTSSQNGGFISTEYESKHITTARMFTKKGSLNLITLSNPIILSSLNSRYDNGYMVCLDYSNFEPSIIKSLLGCDFPDDLHTYTSEILGIDRSDVKTLNMAILYGGDFDDQLDTIYTKLNDVHKCQQDSIKKYLMVMSDIRERADKYIQGLISDYEISGFVINTYGRKIFPKESRNIFSNVIQSIGSEILVDVIIKLNQFLLEGEGKKAHLLFHRFDAVYFDMSKGAVIKHLGNLIKIMESVNDTIQLKVDIQLGKELTSLKELQIE